MDRDQFLQYWNGVATVFFFAGIFLSFRVGLYSATLVGFFMWIIGGTIANMLYGSKKKNKKTLVQNQEVPTYESSIYCSNCGVENSRDSQFCMECGTTLINSPSDETMKPLK